MTNPRDTKAALIRVFFLQTLSATVSMGGLRSGKLWILVLKFQTEQVRGRKGSKGALFRQRKKPEWKLDKMIHSNNIFLAFERKGRAEVRKKMLRSYRLASSYRSIHRKMVIFLYTVKKQSVKWSKNTQSYRAERLLLWSFLAQRWFSANPLLSKIIYWWPS